MTRSEYSAAVDAAKTWGNVVYQIVAASFMVVVYSIIMHWLPEFRAMCMIFHDPAKRPQDDGFYAAMTGILISVTVAVPSMLLALLPFIRVHRKLGVNCPLCDTSLTLWRRWKQVLSSGVCCKCHAIIFTDDDSHETDEPSRGRDGDGPSHFV